MALMKLWSGYGQTQRSLDELLEEAQEAVNTMPENTATFTYYGVEVLFSATSVAYNTKLHIMAALRLMRMPIVVPNPSPLSNEETVKLADDMMESEDKRRARLMAEQTRLDNEMVKHLDTYENMLSRNCHSTPFMFADWVGGAMTLLCNPMLSYMMRQRFNYLMTGYSHLTNPLGSIDGNIKQQEPHVQARLRACKIVYDAIKSSAENRTPYGDHIFTHEVNLLREQQDALDMGLAA